ncbi:MAG TPA: OprD family outer membrane porin [Chthoniobacterales bacterium]
MAALVVILSGTDSALGQQPVAVETSVNADGDSIGAVERVPTPNSALTSVEQGKPNLDQSFDWHQFQLTTRRHALEDTQFFVNLRTFYFDRSDFTGAEKQAVAFGGWAGLRTGYFLDHIAFGATVYTTTPVYAADDRDGTSLLEEGQNGFTVLGEFYVNIRIVKDIGVTVGARGFDTPFISRNDNRMLPNTFEAVVLQGRYEFGDSSSDADAAPSDGLGPSKDDKSVAVPSPTPAPEVAAVKYGLGYFYQIKERNENQFVSLGEDAGANAERGVWAGGAQYEKGKFSIGAIEYYCADVINIAYAQTGYQIPVSDELALKLSAQYTDEGSVGENLLDGNSFSGHQVGLKLDLPVEKALFTAGFTHAWGNANLRNPWSGYPGYTSVQVQDFNRAGETAFLLRAGYDFPWVDGLSAYGLAVFGTNPDSPTQFRQNEFDANVQWGPTKGLLKGLSLRLRYAVVQQFGGNVDNLTDFRAICNYEIKF